MTIDIELAGGGHVLVYQTRDTVFMERFDAALRPLDSGPTAVLAHHSAWVGGEATPDGGFRVAVASSDGGLLSRDFNAMGQPTGSFRYVEDPPAPQPTAFTSDAVETSADGRLAVSVLEDGGYVRATTSEESGSSTLRIERYDYDYTPFGAAFSQTVANQTAFANPKITPLADGGYAVAYINGGADHSALFVQSFNADGSPRALAEVARYTGAPVPDHVDGLAISGLPGGGFVVAWTADKSTADTVGGLWRREYLANGAPTSDPISMGQAQPPHQVPDIDVMADGQFTISWAQPNIPGGLQHLRNTAAEATLGDTNDTVVTPAPDYVLSSGPTQLTLIGTQPQTVVSNEHDTLIRSNNAGSRIVDRDGSDTMVAGRGADTFTGTAGHDTFRYEVLPWNAGHVTDFAVGTDRLDFSKLFETYRYFGEDAVLDHWVLLSPDGQGGTRVSFDTNGPLAGGDWPFLVTTLDGVSPEGLNWEKLSPPPEPSMRFSFYTNMVAQREGDSGTTDYAFTVQRTGDLSRGYGIEWSAFGSGPNPADIDDFEGPTNGALLFQAGSSSAVIHVHVRGDTSVESDETFQVFLTDESQPTVTAPDVAEGLIGNDDTAPPPPADQPGQVIDSPGPGSTLLGGAGGDTLNASQGADVLTGGGGSDAFVYHAPPWSAGRITDFALGADRLDLSAIFQGSGYAGSDPIADGRMRFEDDGAGGTRVYFDTDAPNSGQWPFLITTLEQVSPTGLTWADLSAANSGEPPPPPPPPPPPESEAGVELTWSRQGDTLTGGAGNDTLHASRGPDQLTGGGGEDHFAWAELPWNAGHVADFTPGADKLDLRALFAASGYSGADPLADGRLEFRPDGAGNTQIYFDNDAPGAGDWPWLVTSLDHVAPAQIGVGDWLFR